MELGRATPLRVRLESPVLRSPAIRFTTASLGASLAPQRLYQPLDLWVAWCQRRELLSKVQRGQAVPAFLEIGHQGAQDAPVSWPLQVGLLEHGKRPGQVARAVQGHCVDAGAWHVAHAWLPT